MLHSSNLEKLRAKEITLDLKSRVIDASSTIVTFGHLLLANDQAAINCGFSTIKL